MSTRVVGDYEYNENDQIGEGTFGTVFIGRHREIKGCQVAIKTINLRRTSVKTMPSEVRNREIDILKIVSAASPKNLVSLLSHETGQHMIYLVMELCNGGNLRDYLEERGRFSESVIRQFFQQIASGLKFLHDQKPSIIHRDLKPENVLINSSQEDFVLKIADFGLGRALEPEERADTYCGTLSYMAPEIRKRESYDRKVDLWSIGTMIYECFLGIGILVDPVNKIELPGNASKEIRELLEKLTEQNPQNRFDCDQLLAHEFMREREETSITLPNDSGEKVSCTPSLDSGYGQSKASLDASEEKISVTTNCFGDDEMTLSDDSDDELWYDASSGESSEESTNISVHPSGEGTGEEVACTPNSDSGYGQSKASLDASEEKISFTSNYFADDKIGQKTRGRRSNDKDASSDELYRPRGLTNLGFTCYFNSILQVLCHTHILCIELGRSCLRNGLAWSLFEMSQAMQIGQPSHLNPKKLHQKFVNKVPRFSNLNILHDSHECLRHFLNEIRNEERIHGGSSSDEVRSLTAVDKIFGSHLVTVIICKECDKPYHLFEPYLDLSLPVLFNVENEKPNNKTLRNMHQKTDKATGSMNTRGSEIQQFQENCEIAGQEINYQMSIKKLTNRLSDPCKAKSSTLSPSSNSLGKFFSPRFGSEINLHDCLEHFSRVEQIHEEYLCEYCLKEAMAKGKANKNNVKLTSATKQTLIFNPPAVLAIHLKMPDSFNGRSSKRPDKVKYPEYLDIAPYCSSECLRNDPPRKNIWYSLYAVVANSGSFEFGQYKAYVKVRGKLKNVETLEAFLQKEYFDHIVDSDELMDMMKTVKEKTYAKSPESDATNWYLANDKKVRPAKLDEVLKQEACILFYERIDGIETVSTAQGFATASYETLFRLHYQLTAATSACEKNATSGHLQH